MTYNSRATPYQKSESAVKISTFCVMDLLLSFTITLKGLKIVSYMIQVLLHTTLICLEDEWHAPQLQNKPFIFYFRLAGVNYRNPTKNSHFHISYEGPGDLVTIVFIRKKKNQFLSYNSQ